jgi:hypothetical protein
MRRKGKSVSRFESTFNGIVDDFPVYEVFGMKNRQARNTLERTGRQVIVLTRSSHAYIGVTIICIDDGISICTVTIVGVPHL